MDSISQALETYSRELPKLLQDEGKFVLIFADQVVGIFGTYEDALMAGYEKFQLKPFLVKRIQAVETVHQFSRPLFSPQLCHS
jgi:hypothetical protein